MTKTALGSQRSQIFACLGQASGGLRAPDRIPSHCVRAEPSGMSDFPGSVYVHVPFCRHRCGYCNFTVVAGRLDLVPRYLQAIGLELERVPAGHRIDTLYFGGGTPSQLPSGAFLRLVELVKCRFTIGPGGEWTVEANPADVTPAWCAMVAGAGVTRVSLGVQSFTPEKLRVLERDHEPQVARQAAGWILDHGMQLAIDLIFGVPGETLDDWQRDVEEACLLGPHHLSTYGLTYEVGTRFWSRLRRGELLAVGEQLEADMYQWAIDRLTAAGWEHYEVSNFARPGYRCRHNETYWLGRSFYGFGPGAASYVGGVRTVNHRSSWTYMQRVLSGQSPVMEREVLDAESRARERLVFALRRLEGVDQVAFAQETGFQVKQLGGEALERFLAWGLLAECGTRLHLTRRGLLISDSLWPDLLTK